MDPRSDYRLEIDTTVSSYAVILSPQRDPSQGPAVTVQGVKYSVIGEDKKVAWVKSRIKSLGRDKYPTLADFKADLLLPDQHDEKVRDVAIYTLPKSVQPKKELSEILISTEMVSGETGKKLDAFLSDLEQKVHFSGAVAIQFKGQIALCKGYGNSKDQTPNTSGTTFQVASVSKQFTAAAILKLAEREKLNIDGKINQYLEPKFKPPESWRDITVRQLLTHTSRLKNNFDCEKFRVAKEAARVEGKLFEPTTEELFEYFKDEPLRGIEESQPYYSNNGYFLLGAMVENLTGRTYGQFIQEEVLPSKMSSTGYYNDERKSKLPSATGHHLNERFDGLSVENETVAAEAYSAGGLYTTAHDMLIWSCALFSGEVVDAASLLEMTSAQAGQYSCGLEVPDGEVIRQGGILPGGGFKAEFYHLRDSGDTVVLLLNNFDLPLEKIRDGILDIIQGKDPQRIVGSESSQAYFPDGIEYTAGKADTTHQFERSEGRHFIVYPNGQKDLLAPLDTGRFINLKWGTEWSFTEQIACCYDREGKLLGELRRS